MTTPLTPARPGHRARSATTAALLTLGAAAAGATLTAAPALAHDQLLSTTPADGTTVDSVPSGLSLTFSGDLISGQGIQNLVTVTDEAGHQWQDGDASVSGPELSTALCEGLPNGEFDVAYRVVYSDGHSEAQQYSFTVDDPDAPDSAVPEDCGVPNPDAPVSSTGEDPTSAPTGSAAGSTATVAPANPGGAGGGAAGTTGAEPAPDVAGGSADPAADPATATASDAAGAAPAAGLATDPAAADGATTESAPSGLPAWAWAAALGGVLLVAAAVALVFRRARAIDAPASEPGTEDRAMRSGDDWTGPTT